MKILSAAAALLTTGALVVWLQGRPSAHPVIARTLARQSQLPPEAQRAIQALRLAGAVQFAFFSSERRYGLPQELKQRGYLDPRWPRVDPVYRVTCGADNEGFICYADSSAANLPWFRSDATQSIRWRLGGRPDLSSPVFE